MPTLFKSRIVITLLSLAVVAAPQGLRAQGSAGGSIGNDDKAVSGSRQERAVEREKPSRRSREATPARATKSGNSFDGAWMVSGVGNAVCPGNVNNAVIVTNGHIDGGGAQGTVSANGALYTTARGNGMTMVSTGKLSGRRGTGTFRQTDGCGGTWTAIKQ